MVVNLNADIRSADEVLHDPFIHSTKLNKTLNRRRRYP